MEMIFVLVSIVQSIAIALGVGCSTVAIVSFFVAISDGNINPEERRMLGVVYTLLRLAMVFILLSTILLFFIPDGSLSTLITPFITSRWVLVAVLFINSLLMTKHIMPSNIGPAIQAGTWYTLGVTGALIPLGLVQYSFLEFTVGYLATLALAVALVNATMAHLKHKALQK